MLQQPLAVSALTSDPAALSRDELDAFLRIPGEWSHVPDGDEDTCAELARKGLLVSDADDAELRELRRRDELLTASQWHVFAALYHFLTRWQGQDSWRELADATLPPDAPPPAFHSLDRAAIELPRARRDSALDELLRRRRTTRGFDRSRPLPLADLAALLDTTFGCEGYLPLGGDAVALHKTSPSGGGLHPTEAYPLVRDVDGLEPGLYHYDVARHALEVMATMPADEVEALAVRIAAGQPFVRDAHALVLLTSRFHRSFWKYRRHDRAYRVLLMDAAHLSQTFHLVCADLGLGAFVTAAINDVDAEEALGLDGFAEGAIALLGCGPPAPSPLDPEFLPYVPRETRL